MGAMNSSHPIVVIGCGGLGSAACHWLAQEAGSAVLGLEQFELGHVRGASQDHSRIIRLAQHQDAYADLAPDAYAAWDAVEQASGVTLHVRTGGLVIEDVAVRDAATTGTRNVAGYEEVMRRHGVEFERLTAGEIMQRWPQFRLAGERAGHLPGRIRARRRRQGERRPPRPGPGRGRHDPRPDAGTGAAAARATASRSSRPRRPTSPRRSSITADAWTNTLLAGLGRQLPLTVTQEQVTYYATPNLREFAPDRFPVFMWHGRDNFYGFPVYGEVATKLGQHNGGHVVTADTRSFEPDPVRVQRQRDFLAEHVPGFLGPELYTKTCLYTIPPDQHFVLDTVPEHPNVAVAVGAGHAFKFASLLGRVLTDLALRGKTGYPIDEFALDRPALTDPHFQRSFHV